MLLAEDALRAEDHDEHQHHRVGEHTVVGEGAQQRLFANRYDTRDDGQLALLALENEQEYAIIKHCFEELKAKLAAQAAEAAAQEGEPEA